MKKSALQVLNEAKNQKLTKEQTKELLIKEGVIIKKLKKMTVLEKIEELKQERKVYIEDFVKMSKYVTSLSFENDKELAYKLLYLSDNIFKKESEIAFLSDLK